MSQAVQRAGLLFNIKRSLAGVGSGRWGWTPCVVAGLPAAASFWRGTTDGCKPGQRRVKTWQRYVMWCCRRIGDRLAHRRGDRVGSVVRGATGTEPVRSSCHGGVGEAGDQQEMWTGSRCAAGLMAISRASKCCHVVLQDCVARPRPIQGPTLPMRPALLFLSP
ncbi:hypothetical protein IWX49DRAFT_122340 [Phyllosticta citricarpa]